jgi:hypothetical protein
MGWWIPRKETPTCDEQELRLWDLVETGRWSDAEAEAWLPRAVELAFCKQGNFALQLLLSLCTSPQLDALAGALRHKAVTLARHAVGCRILCRVAEQCYREPAAGALLAELSPHLRQLAGHPFGNFVVQKLLEHAPELPGLDAMLRSCVYGELAASRTTYSSGATRFRRAVVLRALELGLVRGDVRARLLRNRSGRVFWSAAAAAAQQEAPAPAADEWRHYWYLPQWLPSAAKGDPPLLVYWPHKLCPSAATLTWRVEARQLRLFRAGSFTHHLQLAEACGSFFSLELFPSCSDRWDRATAGPDEEDLVVRLVLKRLRRGCEPWSAFRVGLSEDDLRRHDFAACHLCPLGCWTLEAGVRDDDAVDLRVFLRATEAPPSDTEAVAEAA